MALPFSISILKQLLALLVMLSIFGCARGSVRGIEKERLAVLDFKKSFLQNEGTLPSWKSTEGKNCCTWEGITCDNLTGHVVSLHLHNYGLKSYQLRPSLLELRYLSYLDLSDNDFAMRIPDFIGSFSKLAYLDLSGAGFSGKIPPHLGNLSNIQTLNLSFNQLSSDNFQWISHLSSLKDLQMSETNFSEAKDWLSAIRKLPLLSSFYCSLSSLPPPVFSSTPPQVNSSTSLKTIGLSGSLLYPSVISWLMNSSSSLSELYLSDVNLEGPFPNLCHNMTCLEWLSHLSSLTSLHLSSANFGHARDWLSTIRKLPLLASFNCFNCSLPPPVFSSTPDHVNFSTSMESVDLSLSNLSSSTLFWFLNNCSNLSILKLSYLNLDGPFPDLFQNKISLEHLYLYGNQLERGIFKSIGKLCKLKELYASECGLKQSLADVLQALTSCASSSLESLDLGWNNLTGTIPPMLKFQLLRGLHLSDNRLDGFQPRNSRHLPKLQVSDIFSNDYINGSLQNTLPFLPASLSDLDLSSNSLNGVFSDAYFTNFSNLIDLDLSNNPNITISFSKPPLQIESIRLTSCKLGPNFPSWLLTQNSISWLDISNSKISGSVPISFWNNLPSSLLYLNLSFNSFHDVLPNLPFHFDSDAIAIDLSSNAFFGLIPFSLFKANVLLLSTNNFSGFAPIPHSENFSASLPSIMLDAGSNVVDISNNLLSCKLPVWLWFHLPVLGTLNLANNNLSGTIPSSIGNTSALYVLNLSNNRFSGPLPLWLKNCTQLRILDLGGNSLSSFIPSWLGEDLKNLVVLSLQSNNLTGTLPASICHLNYLQILDLSYNKLSGSIPSCVHNFTAMAHDVNLSTRIFVLRDSLIFSVQLDKAYIYYAFINWKGMDRKFQRNLRMVRLIDLSNNNLSGEIPNGLTSLFGLKSLDLSSNNLNGRIPEQIGQLQQLEFLNLSYNGLCGRIPQSLADISELTMLNLSHNNLVGRIPTSTQLQSFHSSAYADNPGLCGLPLPTKCPGDGEDPVQVLETSKTYDSGKEHEWPDAQCFYAGMGTGFAFGFLAILCTLFFITKWRHAFFRFAGDFADWILLVVPLSISKISRKLHL